MSYCRWLYVWGDKPVSGCIHFQDEKRTEVRWLKTTFSRTLIPFYLMEIAIVVFLFYIVGDNTSPLP